MGGADLFTGMRRERPALCAGLNRRNRDLCGWWSPLLETKTPRFGSPNAPRSARGLDEPTFLLAT